MTSPTFTVGQIAKMLGVSSNTVKRWCNRGRLKSHRLPDTKRRRVLRRDLEFFLAVNKMPTLEQYEASGAKQ